LYGDLRFAGSQSQFVELEQSRRCGDFVTQLLQSPPIAALEKFNEVVGQVSAVVKKQVR